MAISLCLREEKQWERERTMLVKFDEVIMFEVQSQTRLLELLVQIPITNDYNSSYKPPSNLFLRSMQFKIFQFHKYLLVVSILLLVILQTTMASKTLTPLNGIDPRPFTKPTVISNLNPAQYWRNPSPSSAKSPWQDSTATATVKPAPTTLETTP